MILEERKRAEEMARRISKERKNLIPDEIKKQILDFIEKDLVRNEYTLLFWANAGDERWEFSYPGTSGGYIKVPNSLMSATKDWIESLGGFYCRPDYHPVSYNHDGYKVYLKK